jgi:hypothetical protein
MGGSAAAFRSEQHQPHGCAHQDKCVQRTRIPGRSRTVPEQNGSSPAGQSVRQRPRPAGPLRGGRNARPVSSGPSGPTRGQAGAPAAAGRPPDRPRFRRRRRGGTSLTPAVCRAGWQFPPGEAIGRTRPGAGSRPRRGRSRPPDPPRHAIHPVIPGRLQDALQRFLGPRRAPWTVPRRGPLIPPLMGPPEGWGPCGRRPRLVCPGQTLRATWESARSIHCPSMGLLRRPTPGEIVEGGRLGRPCGPGVLSRAISENHLRTAGPKSHARPLLRTVDLVDLALAVVDPAARPRSWRTCGLRRLGPPSTASRR